MKYSAHRSWTSGGQRVDWGAQNKGPSQMQTCGGGRPSRFVRTPAAKRTALGPPADMLPGTRPHGHASARSIHFLTTTRSFSQPPVPLKGGWQRPRPSGSAGFAICFPNCVCASRRFRIVTLPGSRGRVSAHVLQNGELTCPHSLVSGEPEHRAPGPPAHRAV